MSTASTLRSFATACAFVSFPLYWNTELRYITLRFGNWERLLMMLSGMPSER